MTASKPEASFTVRRVQEMLGLSRSVVTGLISSGFVSPSRGPKNEYRFTFQDLMLLRTAFALQQAKISPRRILGSLKKLTADLPSELPLTGLRITAVGAVVAVREPSGHLKSDTGQLLMDFEVAQVGGSVTFITPKPASEAATANDWFSRGQASETTDVAAAEAAYRSALALDPVHAHAYLNLGALLCETSRCEEAVELFDLALANGVADARVHFNHAIALEDLGRRAEALKSYSRALTLEPTLADAHYNAGMLLEAEGDDRGALRHFSAYRRLE